MEFDAVCQRLGDTLNRELAGDGSNQQVAIRLLNAALPACGFTLRDPNTLEKQSFTEDDKALLGDGLRRYAVNLIKQAVSAGQCLMRCALPQAVSAAPVLPRLLSVVCWLAEAQLVSAEAASQQESTPSQGSLQAEHHVLDNIHYFRIVEDVIEAAAIDDEQQLFELLVEGSRMIEALAVETTQVGPNHAAKLCIVRTINFLLRRLSKTQDLELCGRILIFSTRLYTLNHTSGVNHLGKVNSSLPPPALDEVAPDACDSSGDPVDAKLYQTFWGLQQVFKTPASVLQPAYWAKTAADLELVLEQLEARKVTVKASPSFLASAATGPDGSLTTNSTVHYLSSSKLFGLQLRDASFRRQFLVQCIILLHHMRNPSKSDKVPAGTKFDKLEELEKRVYAAMAATEERGQEFADAVKHVLGHETKWVRWKHNPDGGKTACPPFERPPALPYRPAAAITAGGVSEGAQALAPPAKRMRRAGPRSAAAPSVTLLRQLQEPADQMAGLKASERRYKDKPDLLLPSFDEFVDPVMMELDPESCVEPQYRRLNTDKVFCWKVLRSLSREHLDSLGALKGVEDLPVEVGKALLEHYPAKKKQFEEYKARKAAEEAKERAALLAEMQQDKPQEAQLLLEDNGGRQTPSTAAAMTAV